MASYFCLKLSLATERYTLSRYGVYELYGLSMEHKTLGTRAIDIITDDWRTKTVGMCCVNT